MHVEGEDGWTVIASVSRQPPTGRKKKKNVVEASQVQYDSEVLTNHEEKVRSSQTALEVSRLLLEFLKKHSEKQKSLTVHIEALGLGNIHAHRKPRLQFYLLKTILNTVMGACNITINIYDPVFNGECVALIKQLPIEASIKHYEPGNHTSAQLTLYFMPHCEKQLYEQVVLAATAPYAIIGNSFDNYRERELLLHQPKTAVFYQRTFTEIAIPDYESAFNDTYFITNP